MVERERLQQLSAKDRAHTVFVIDDDPPPRRVPA